MKGNYLTADENKRRMDAYKKFHTNEEIANYLGIHIECLRKWIRMRGLKQKNKHYRVYKPHKKAKKFYDSIDGGIGYIRKRKSYVNKCSDKERMLMKHFMIHLIEITDRNDVSVSDVMEAYRQDVGGG